MNTSTTAYLPGYGKDDVLAYANQLIKDKSLLSLGGFGGYIILGFNHAIKNVQENMISKFTAMLYYDMYGTASGKLGGVRSPESY